MVLRPETCTPEGKRETEIQYLVSTSWEVGTVPLMLAWTRVRMVVMGVVPHTHWGSWGLQKVLPETQ